MPDNQPPDPDEFDEDFDEDFDDDFDDFDEGFDFDVGEPMPLDDHESAMVQQDLVDLDAFEHTFRAEGFRGVSVSCQDCQVEHYYPWELLRENLRLLLETGETPVHEPAFDPDPAHYVPWEYARGYVDALSDVGVGSRAQITDCPNCGMDLSDGLAGANYCPRCSTPLIAARLDEALASRGVGEDERRALLREIGLPN